MLDNTFMRTALAMVLACAIFTTSAKQLGSSSLFTSRSLLNEWRVLSLTLQTLPFQT